MKVLVIGGGGREHALAWRLAQSQRVSKVYVAPGNGGTRADARYECVDVSEPAALREWAQKEKISVTLVSDLFRHHVHDPEHHDADDRHQDQGDPRHDVRGGIERFAAQE